MQLLNNVYNDRPPSNDGLTKDYYKMFWNELKEIFVDSVSRAKETGHLITSQRQAISTLTEKYIEVNGQFKPGENFCY